jgi:flagellar basal body-associated protein FliL
MILEKRQLGEPKTMSTILIALSLVILLVLGVAALFLAGGSHNSSSAEDPSDDE